MVKDYHIHPQIIQNPNNFDSFVKTALKNEVQEICITDHMPLLGSSAGDRIPHGAVREYCEKARAFAETYKSLLSVKVGIEIDYHPSITDEVESVIKQGDFDFILGSSHLHAIEKAKAFESCKTRTQYAEAMLRNTKSAAESGCFNAIAHIDMYRWIFSAPQRFPLLDDGFSEQLYEEMIVDTLSAIKKNGLLLEINPHFAVSSKNIENIYPSSYIIQKAMDMGIKFSYGSDAHSSDEVGIMLNEIRNDKIYKKALSIWEID